MAMPSEQVVGGFNFLYQESVSSNVSDIPRGMGDRKNEMDQTRRATSEGGQ